MAQFLAMTEQECKNCGNAFKGTYCNLCGEKINIPEERSFKKILNTLMVAVLNVDSKAIKSLGYILFKPGFLSGEISNGRTVGYVKPMALFFVLNLIYFLFPLIQLFNATWKTQLSSVYGSWVLRRSVHKMLEMDLPRSAFELMYNDKTVAYAKMMVIAFAVLASLPLNFLYRKTKKFFGDHLNLMVELACFNLFLNAMVITLVAKVFPVGIYLNDNILSVLFLGTNLYFLIRSGYVFYGGSTSQIILKSLVMTGFLKVALETYRFLLFLITINSV
ncbi:MAG: DUF3667 domain-containing protein [Cyclobacteriaceae bacterium]